MNRSTKNAAQVSSLEFILLPRSELKRMLCKCGQAMGENGYAQVYDHNGMTTIAEIKCAYCYEKEGKPRWQ